MTLKAHAAVVSDEQPSVFTCTVHWCAPRKQTRRLLTCKGSTRENYSGELVPICYAVVLRVDLFTSEAN